jgi:hypothetical protein
MTNRTATNQWAIEFAGMTFEQRLERGKQIMQEYANGSRRETAGPISLSNGLTMPEVEDTEVLHIRLDELLLAIIGDGDLERDFNSIGKWYA